MYKILIICKNEIPLVYKREKTHGMNEPKINTKLLTLARESRGLSLMELASKIDTSHANINRWEAGSVHINAEYFNRVQKALYYPESFFYQQGEIYPPTFYRRRDKVAAKVLNKLDANLNIYRFNLNQVIKATNYELANLPSLPLEKYETPQKAAQELRKKWKIGRGAIENLAQIIEENNIMLLSIDFETDRVDGHSILTDNRHPVIFTNKSLLGDRQRFTLAYELGHLVMHAFGSAAFGTDLGHEANVFAAEFLMPEKEIRQDFKGKINLALLAELKKKWKVSMQAIFYRACDLGFLDYNQQRYILSQFNQLKIRRREPPELDVPREQYKLVRDLLTQYRIKQKITVANMAAYLHLEQDDFLQRYNY